MRKKFLLVFILIFLFVFWQKNALAQGVSPPVATPTEVLQGEKEGVENWEKRMMPQSLKGNECSWLKNIFAFLGLFTCKSYNVQRIVNPEELGAEHGETQGIMTEGEVEELEGLLAAPEGEVKGISIPIIGDIFSVARLLVKKEDSGAYNVFMPAALEGYLPQEETAEAVKKGTEKTEIALLPAAFGGNGTRDYFEDAPIPTPIYTNQPLSQISPVSSLRSIFNQVEQWNGVPWQVVEAIARIEGPSLFNKSDEEIVMYSQPGAQFPDNCNPNSCSAAGPMQFTTGGENLNINKCSSASGWKSRIVEDSADGSLSNSCFRNAANNLGINIASITESQAEQIVRACWPNKWSAHKDAVVQATGENRMPNVCNVEDSIFATGHMLDYTRTIRQQYCNANRTRYQFCCQATDSWDDPNLVKCVSTAYYGQCSSTYARLDNKTYCDFVWDYYQQNKDMVVENPNQTENISSTVEQPVNLGRSDRAIQIVGDIQASCIDNLTRGVVSFSNLGCLNNVSSISTDARAIMRDSTNTSKYLQCVGYVKANAYDLDNINIQTTVPAAVDFARNIPPEYRFVQNENGATPRTGDLLIWDIGAYGHIAYIAEVLSNKYVRVAEANWGVSGKVQTRPVVLEEPVILKDGSIAGILGWLRKI